MPIGYEIDHERQLVLVNATEPVDGSQTMAIDETLRGDLAFDPKYSQLLDFGKVTGETIHTDIIRTLASRPPLFSRESRRAVVVSTKLDFGLVRMFELMRNESAGHFEIFYSLAEAESWLEAETSEVPEVSPAASDETSSD